MDEQKKEDKPGFKTTEFWLSSVATIVGLIVASGAFSEESQAMQIAGLAMSALAALGYTGSRAKVKSKK